MCCSRSQSTPFWERHNVGARVCAKFLFSYIQIFVHVRYIRNIRKFAPYENFLLYGTPFTWSCRLSWGAFSINTFRVSVWPPTLARWTADWPFCNGTTFHHGDQQITPWPHVCMYLILVIESCLVVQQYPGRLCTSVLTRHTQTSGTFPLL